MRYVKITKENAGSLLTNGAILSYCSNQFKENELDELKEDKVVDIIERINNTQVTIIAPDTVSNSIVELNHFTDGHWWLDDFSKRKEFQNDGMAYIMLVCSIILLSLAAYMFVNDTNLSGFDGPGRFGGPTTKGFVSAPFVLIVGLVLLGCYIYPLLKKRK
jgi:hypothetical protein